jgi:DNA polymerase-1
MVTSLIQQPVALPSEPPVKGVLATDDDMPWILGMLDQAVDIAVDTETSGLSVRDGRDYLMGFCLDVTGLATYLPFRHEYGNIGHRWLEPLHNIFKRKPLIWHHRKFDMHSAKTIGLDPLEWTGKQYCTMVAARLLDNEMYAYGLDSLAKQWLPGLHKWDKDQIQGLGQAIGFEKIPPEMYKDYGPVDAHITRRLRDYIWPKLEQRELASVYWDTEEPFTALLYTMEQRGVGVNTDFCSLNAERGRLRMDSIQRNLGYNPASPLDLKRVLLNELNLPVFQHTSGCDKCKKKWPVDSHEGPPSFNKVAMEDYDLILSMLDNPTAKLITEYRGWQKAVTSLYEPMLTKVSPDGRIRPNFKQHGTKTGRLSCEDPNLQQVPRESDKVWNGHAKSAFNSGRDGYSLYGWDYSQIELRLAAAYGQDKVLLAEFESDSADPFGVLAPLIFPDYTVEHHEDFKFKTKHGLVYPSLYGAGLYKVALSLGLTESETKPVLERFRTSTAGITTVSHQVASLVQQRGFVKYWDGRQRNFRDRRNDAHKAWNSVLQGGSAQLLKKAMLRCREFENDECYMVLSVHDEITFIVQTDLIPKYEPLILNAMLTGWDFGVRLDAKGKEWK